jgi:hypothetical protein
LSWYVKRPQLLDVRALDRYPEAMEISLPENQEAQLAKDCALDPGRMEDRSQETGGVRMTGILLK